MTTDLALVLPVLAIVAGIIILVQPRLLSYAVASFLIAFGALRLLGIN